MENQACFRFNHFQVFSYLSKRQSSDSGSSENAVAQYHSPENSLNPYSGSTSYSDSELNLIKKDFAKIINKFEDFFPAKQSFTRIFSMPGQTYNSLMKLYEIAVEQERAIDKSYKLIGELADLAVLCLENCEAGNMVLKHFRGTLRSLDGGNEISILVGKSRILDKILEQVEFVAKKKEAHILSEESDSVVENIEEKQ